MFITFLKSKIAHARITQAELYYEGSITIDENLLKSAGIIPGEKVEVLNVNTGSRIETYAIAGKNGSGIVCLNGPAARSGAVGDEVIVLSYGIMEQSDAANFKAKIIKVDDKNQIRK